MKWRQPHSSSCRSEGFRVQHVSKCAPLGGPAPLVIKWPKPADGSLFTIMVSKLKFATRWMCALLASALILAAAEKAPDRMLPVHGFCIASPAEDRVDEFLK